MLFEAERALHQGYRAWLRGELGKAVSLCEASRAARPGSIDPLYPLSRALSESGERDRALAAIDEAIASEPGNPAGRLFRAIILLDHGDLDGARKDLDGIPAPHPLAAALGALAALGERGAGTAPAEPVAIAPAARWIPDAAGRILAVLEADLHAGHAGDATDFHHGLFSPGAGAPAGPGAAAAPPRIQRPADRRRAVEAAFRSKDFEGVERLYRDPAAGEGWHDATARIQRAFALIALGREGCASSFVAECLESQPECVDLHFLAGVAHAKAGRRREAGWSFTRAARLADIEIDAVIRDLSGKVAGRIVWLPAGSGRTSGHPPAPRVD